MGPACKPRHVPSFCKTTRLAPLVGALASQAEVALVSKTYEAGTIGLRRFAAVHQNELDGFVSDFSKRSTRLSTDTCDRNVITVGFTGRKKRWTLCPSSHCIPKAEVREKIVGQWKFVELPRGGDALVVPRCVNEAYAAVVDDSSYFAATLCPQQTYSAKHRHQDGIMDQQWHRQNRHKFALQDFVVFCDFNQRVRAVWRLRRPQDKFSDWAGEAEAALLQVMYRILVQMARGDESPPPKPALSDKCCPCDAPRAEMKRHGCTRGEDVDAPSEDSSPSKRRKGEKVRPRVASQK